jgi:hypothetical protein
VVIMSMMISRGGSEFDSGSNSSGIKEGEGTRETSLRIHV